MPFFPPAYARKFTPEFFRLRPFAGRGVDRGYEYGYWWCEWGGELDTIRDQPRVRDELMAVVMGIWDHIKNHDEGRAAAANWALDWCGMLPGKRESRRFTGQTIMTQADILKSRVAPDAIAYGGWGIDIHPPEGIDRPDLPPYVKTNCEHIYDIPLRSCISSAIPNLLFAGRNHSATHVAFASNRVMATCAVMGQGVGTAAAYACARGLDAAQITGVAQHIHAVQQRLLRDDCYLIGVLNQDPHDLARQARISADSIAPGSDPANLISGQTRSVHGPRGAAPERARAGQHRWISARLPASVELRWDHVQVISEVQVIFDTGLHRMLTLSQSDGAMAAQVWGRPQPETMREVVIEAETASGWEEIGRISNNWQRRWVGGVGLAGRVGLAGSVSGVETRAIRLRVLASHGVDQARVCEVRVYGPGAPGWV